MSDNPENFKIGTGNRKIKAQNETLSKNEIIQKHFGVELNPDDFDYLTRDVVNNPVPYGEESIADRINKINSLNKTGYVCKTKKTTEKPRENININKNINLKPQLANDNIMNINELLDNHNLLLEKQRLESKLRELDELDKRDYENQQFEIESENQAIGDSKISDVHSQIRSSADVNKVSVEAIKIIV
jgi:hypothetical protein